MEEADSLLFKQGVNGLGIYGKGPYVPAPGAEMSANVEGITRYATPSVGTYDMYKGIQLVAASITLMSTLGRLRKEPISLSTNLPWKVTIPSCAPGVEAII